MDKIQEIQEMLRTREIRGKIKESQLQKGEESLFIAARKVYLGKEQTNNLSVQSQEKKRGQAKTIHKTRQEEKVSNETQYKTFTDHFFPVWSVAFSPNGEYLASGSCNEILVWGVSNGKLIKSLPGHSFQVWTTDTTIGEWSFSTGELVKTLTGHSQQVNSVAYSPKGEYLVSASDDKTMCVWRVQSGQLIKNITEHTSKVNSVAFSPNGEYLASGSYRDIFVWKVSSWERIKTLTGHSCVVNSVVFSQNGVYLASGSGTFGSENNTIGVWKVQSWRRIKTLTGHSDSVNSVAFSPNGKCLASVSGFLFSPNKDNTIRVWNL